MKHQLILVVGLLLLAAACTTPPAPTQVPATPVATPVLPVVTPASSMLALTVAKTTLGSIIADSDGKTLYMYTKDTKDTSACYGACATNWPPLLADKIDAKDDANAKLIGYTKRTDGKMQVTYNGMPLYYYAKDTKPGDTTGQNVGGIWFVLAADGKVIKLAASDTAAQTFTVLVSAEDTTIGAELNAFFPTALHIHVGDTVVWKENSHELHTVTFLGNLTTVPDLLVQVPNAPPGAMMINPQAGFPAGPTDGKYDGAVYVNSGMMGMDPGQALQFSLTFTKPGTYQYVCIVHNTMKMDKTMKMEGTIIVEDAKTPIPTQAEVAVQAKKEMDALMAKVPTVQKAANAAIKPAVKNADGTMTYFVGMGYASGQIDMTAFFPSKLTAKPGDTIVWTLGEMNMAPHTLTFLNGATEPDLIVPQPQPNGPPLLLFNPAVALPQNADKPLTNKGIYNSGMISPDAPGTHTFSLKVGDFTESLEFLCLLHDANGMKGTLTVSK